jgi:DNA replication protein DnaC
MTTFSATRLSELCTTLKLPTVAAQAAERFSASGHGDALESLCEVLELEIGDRRERRVERLRREARFPAGKTFDTLEQDRLPAAVAQRLKELSTGEFLERAINVLAFGLPGTGKSHSLAALGSRLVERGYSVLFAPAYQLVQELLAAKRDLELPRALRRLDHFDALLLDDLGYLKQRPEEAEVLFTLIAERYERRSLLVTSNLVFSQWDQIFHSPMATAAAIDRIVHHSVILEFDVPSYRTDAARSEKTPKGVSPSEKRPGHATSRKSASQNRSGSTITKGSDS